MAKDVDESQPKTAPGESGERVVQWVHDKRRSLTIVAAGVVLIGGATWFVQTAQARREAFAANELSAARISVDAGNYQLASTDLGRIASSYAGTSAGEEAAILLARVHLLQEQADLAVSELRTFLGSGPRRQYVAPAAGLLGGALEDVARYAEAADAYRQAADASDYDLVKAEYLIDVGRSAALGGDTLRAMDAYQELIELEIDDQAKVEAQLRMAELGGHPESDA